ncbi:MULTISPECIES: TRAP transporter large permease [Roseovarius]|uniref:TRAP transporter large permease n=1 Tax=Roseovarius TaxID=74030 RepID=UPI001C945B0F|nr:TRAP transporter large permease [Roseovarius atlanticus]MBY5989906.1 TRAP transporter large permease [Roseovarius atlanticus]MBY6126451.1 TRAP transporter large permease [Roseovarius atlanticus]MBY6150945.1 TRAP transporter large permease [Roseovarius atlanticus]
MDALIALPLLILLMGLGLPVAWSFAGVLAYLTWVYDVNLNTLMLQGFRSLNSVVLVALPLFILTGYLMQSGGIARRIIAFVSRLATGRGGMGTAMVLSSSIFGAISGTATAAIASIGSIMTEPLVQRGYPRGRIAALLGISSLLGILIPPSITMILFAVVTRQSVAACFAATIGPAIILIIGLILYNRFLVGRAFDEIELEAEDTQSFGRVTLNALPALSLPIIILGGIYGGIFTPTEAAAVAAVAALIVGGLIYREFTWGSLGRSVLGAAETTGTIILILLFSFMISRIMAFERVPQDLTEAIQSVVTTPVGALLVVNLVLIVAGALMDDVSVTVVIAPLFLPLMVANDIDPVHFAAIVACSVVIGANSPPVAPTLFLSCKICRVPILQAVMPALGLMGFVAFPVLMLTTFWPDLSLTIPRLFGLM